MSISEETWNELHATLKGNAAGTCIGCGSANDVHTMRCVYSQLFRGWSQMEKEADRVEAEIERLTAELGPVQMWEVQMAHISTATVYVEAGDENRAGDKAIDAQELAPWKYLQTKILSVEPAEKVPTDGLLVG